VIQIAATRKKSKKEKQKIAPKSIPLSTELTEIEMKLLRLALDKGAYEGEAENAAIMFIRKLRERNVKADELFAETPVLKYGNETMTFGKYRNEMIKNIPINYLIWVLNNCANIDMNLRAAIQKFVAP
jgi:hypothetical protein